MTPPTSLPSEACTDAASDITPPAGPGSHGITRNLLTGFYDELPAVFAAVAGPHTAPVPDPAAFAPGFSLPALDERLKRFLDAAQASWHDLGSFAGHRLRYLDLARNPGTNTVKTFASLVIVARAVAYSRRFGEAVTIFSPTSANKGTALRDGVLRAIDAGLAEPEQLRVVTVAPASCRAKLRSSRLSADPLLRDLNPVLLYTGEQAEQVKAIARQFLESRAADYYRVTGSKLWFSLELRNYLVADAMRAFFEQCADPPEAAGRPRVHAHAVSSAFGLLGYHEGRGILEARGAADPQCRPASLLVQHLATPDMVLSLVHGAADRSLMPRYRLDEGTGLLRQETDRRFPAITFHPAEVLDATFYTRQPPTSAAMNAIIGKHGGDGIVVSLAECLQRYAFVQRSLSGLDRPLPVDPRALREWSAVMACTGALMAAERGLVEPDADIVIHGSGHYAVTDYEPLDDAAVIPVRDAEDIAAALLAGRDRLDER